MTERPQPESARSVARAPSFASSLPFPGLWRYRRTETTRSSDVDRLEIGRLPTPGARAVAARRNPLPVDRGDDLAVRSEEHTSELQSLMRISYAVFCLKKNNSYKL